MPVVRMTTQMGAAASICTMNASTAYSSSCVDSGCLTSLRLSCRRLLSTGSVCLRSNRRARSGQIKEASSAGQLQPLVRRPINLGNVIPGTAAYDLVAGARL